MEAILAIEDGTVFRGSGFGSRSAVCGEICFNTSMTGYQEILTDPSYRAQIVTMTYPQIGNYGINPEDMESWRAHLAGFVVRELSPVVSNWRSNQSLERYLDEQNIPGIQGIDTRALTRKLREKGAMKGCLVCGESLDEGEAVERARSWKGLNGVDYVGEVMHAETLDWDRNGTGSDEFRLVSGSGNRPDTGSGKQQLPPADIPIVALDLGIKYNILRRLRQQGFASTVVPAGDTLDQIRKRRPAGVFLSNGPGDPSAVAYAIETVKELMTWGIPMFGICLGLQVMGLAMGGRTFKLKFGHRGANHPVQDRQTGRVEITSQNHGYALVPESLPDAVEVDRINLNDGTLEGFRHRSRPFFGVQYHPEASPGPHDSTGLFREFRSLIESS